MVDEIDLLKLCKDWNLHCAPDNWRQVLSDGDINLGLLKAKAVNLRWSEVNHTPIYLERTVKINKSQPADGEAFGHVRSSKICEDRATVTITHGLIKGLNTNLKLPLSGCRQIFAQNFERFLPINPSKPFSDIPVKKLKVEMATEKELHHGDTVLVQAISHEYKASFTCDVVLTGTVPTRGGPQHTIAGMLQDLRDKHIYSSEGDDVIRMAGEVELHWEDYMNQSWQKDN